MRKLLMIGTVVLLSMGSTTYASCQKDENSEADVASETKSASVQLDRPIGSTTGDIYRLALDITVEQFDPTNPYTLSLSLTCASNCKFGPVNLGEISVFPSPRVGERRTFELLLDSSEVPSDLTHAEVHLEPAIEGRNTGSARVRLNSAALSKVGG